MKILENGDYQLDDGRIIPASEIGRQFEKAPKSESAVEAEKSGEKQTLAEGQSSGVIRLED
jgi:hypothetical protein